MNQFTNEELLELIQKATAGDKKALETVLVSVQDLVFNLSLPGCGGCNAGYPAENHYPSILIQRGELFFNLGIPYCIQSSEKLSEAYVCQVPSQF